MEPPTFSIDQSSLYYWKKNSENNQEQLKKIIFTQYSQNDKGDDNPHWIQEFHIGTIMNMSELTINDFEQPVPFEQYIVKDKLYETVIHCSVAYRKK